jgi:hypothetical protein
VDPGVDVMSFRMKFLELAGFSARNIWSSAGIETDTFLFVLNLSNGPSELIFIMNIVNYQYEATDLI